MHQHLIAAACNTGTAWQKYICAHPDMNTPAGRAGFETGQAMGPVLIGLVVLALIIMIARRSGGSRKTATSN
jgi:hypothetical protein